MEVLQLRSGLHYPRSTGEFQSWFATDADCLDYLDWLRWADGLRLPAVRARRAGELWPMGATSAWLAVFGRR